MTRDWPKSVKKYQKDGWERMIYGYDRDYDQEGAEAILDTLKVPWITHELNKTHATKNDPNDSLDTSKKHNGPAEKTRSSTTKAYLQIEELVEQYKDLIQDCSPECKNEYAVELTDLIIEIVNSNKKIRFVVVEKNNKSEKEICIWGSTSEPVINHWAKTTDSPAKLVRITNSFMANPNGVKNYDSLTTVVSA